MYLMEVLTAFRPRAFVYFMAIITLGLTFFGTPFALGAGEANWTVNELSILIPLPKANELSDAFSISSIMDLESYAKAIGPSHGLSTPMIAPAHQANRPSGATEYEWVYLVGIRIDPCFRLKFEDQCRKQIRLVWQPLEFDTNKNIVSIDAALHTLYDLDEKSFEALLASIQKINSPYRNLLNASTDLSINPVIKKLGLSSHYFRQFKSIVYVALRRASLTRSATLEAVTGNLDTWSFFAQDFSPNGAETRVPIPNFIGSEMEFENKLQNPETILASMLEAKKSSVPVPEEEIDRVKSLIGKTGFMGGVGTGGGHFINNLDPAVVEFLRKPMMKYFTDSGSYSSEEMPQLISELSDVENPNKNLPGTVDCLSCHLTEPIRANLRGSKGFETKSFRAFGYFIDKVSISERTRLEAVQVMNALNNK
jgi:hypothetical protein